MTRPTIYTLELGRKICEEISTTSQGLRKICNENDDFPTPRTIYYWILSNNDFAELYRRARELQVQILVDEMIDIADDNSNDIITKTNRDGEEYEVCNTEFINRARLRVDARKWIACKLVPKLYGDKNHTEHSGSIGMHEALLKELA